MKIKQLLLDMGAGANPHPNATHAVDAGNMPVSKKEISDYRIQHKKDLITKLNEMVYTPNFDYNTTKLPYPDNTFTVVYSNGSLGTNGKRFAYKEAYRVLKIGGILEFGSYNSYTIDGLKKFMQSLIDIGFKTVVYTDSWTDIYNGKKRYHIWIKATK